MKINQRGDTIIEVLLATVIISIVLAGAYSMSNRATRINQTAIERTQAVYYMQEQLEIIRLARTRSTPSSTETLWKNVISKANSGSSPDYSLCSPTGGSTSNPFYIDSASNLQSYDPNNPAADAYPLDFYHIWLEAYKGDHNGYGYVDLHARACWEGIGGEVEQKSGIVLRLAV